jgi:phosphoenolpyruvate phosphomutase
MLNYKIIRMFLILDKNLKSSNLTNSELLRKCCLGKEIVKVGGAFDAMSAKLVENAGFDAIWAGSFAISATHALPDASILTMTEFLETTKRMVDACKIPVIADCDTGYGGPSNVAHLVKKYEDAGVAAISIEDKIFPKENSLLENGKNDLLSEKEFVAKIIAAKQSKKQKEFMIIARIEALISGKGIKEALKRATAYENAGADAILIHSKQKLPDEIFEFVDQWKGQVPVIAIPTTYDSVKISDLINHKIKMVIYANQTLRVSHASMSKLLKEMYSAEKICDVKEEMSSMEKIFQLQDMYEHKSEEGKIEQELKKMGYIN